MGTFRQRWPERPPPVSLRRRFGSKWHLRADSAPLSKTGCHSRKDFEEALRNPAQKPTTAKLIREAYRASEVYESENVDEFARWLWGRALEFERKGYPSKSPANLFVALLPEMQDDMRRLVPVLTDFYQQFSEVIR